MKLTIDIKKVGGNYSTIKVYKEGKQLRYLTVNNKLVEEILTLLKINGHENRL